MSTRQHLSNIPIQFAKGVGPRRARLLEKLGICNVEDAFWFVPWRYENRLEVQAIGNILPGMKATVAGRVQSCRVKTTYRKRLVVVTITVHDETGTLECVFFNQPYLEKTFAQGVSVLLTGTVVPNSSGGPILNMRSPQYEMLEDSESDEGRVGRIIPIYHETQGLSSKQIRFIIRSIFDHYAGDLLEILPTTMRQQLGIPELREALSQLHFPHQDYSVEALNQQSTPEHRRLAFEELLLLQLALAMRRNLLVEAKKGIAFEADNLLVNQLKTVLPFSLTLAQKRVIKEIFRDMEQPACMNRLLQGDVGCGKTVVALHAIVMACGSGYQAAFMAPTEVLSEQHYLSLSKQFDELGIQCVLLKGGQAGSDRIQILADIQSGSVQVVVGTHALLQPDVEFAKLGLVIVDEQHKFGVLQRGQLREKASWQPDVLVMTATPIPRTLAMTLYGDLDVSVIDELPPGKKSVQTKMFPNKNRQEAYRLLEAEVQEGRQAYVVYPLVEPSEKVDLQAAIEAVEQLRGEFSQYRIGLLHGRLSSREKQAVMAKFQTQEIDILVATTVVEVGLDVHNATVMLIEHAERFGLAQLHQLRGRVGRGKHQGYCLLIHALGNIPAVSEQMALRLEKKRISKEDSEDSSVGGAQKAEISRSTARQRLAVFEKYADGFILAEEDLKIRGPGHVLGVKQWGELDFRVADVARDMPLLTRAKEEAVGLLERDPELVMPQHQGLKDVLFRKWAEKLALGSIG